MSQKWKKERKLQSRSPTIMMKSDLIQTVSEVAKKLCGGVAPKMDVRFPSPQRPLSQRRPRQRPLNQRRQRPRYLNSNECQEYRRISEKIVYKLARERETKETEPTRVLAMIVFVSCVSTILFLSI